MTSPNAFRSRTTTAQPRDFRTGVSLHSHSAHSLETLAVVATYAERSNRLAQILSAIERRCLQATGAPAEIDRLFFVPPLPPLESYHAEARSIEDDLGLSALVSITDHDTFDGVASLRNDYGLEHTPMSVEWTIPFGPTYLHLGLHNVPGSMAVSLSGELARLSSACAVCRDEGVACFGAHKRLSGGCAFGGCHLGASFRPIASLLEEIARHRDALVVLNHPMWDMNNLGDREQAGIVGRFLSVYGGLVHALEVNGLRPAGENAAAARLAESIGLPAISGGDRHGCEPAAIVNLTNAATFGEFVDEVRSGTSVVHTRPHYSEPLLYRKVRAACDVLRDYPSHSYEKGRWCERVFYRDDLGALRALSDAWPDGDPVSVRASRRVVQALGAWPISPAVRRALGRRRPAA